MTPWLIAPIVLFVVVPVLAVVGQLWRTRDRRDTPVSDQWRATQDYDKRGDRGK